MDPYVSETSHAQDHPGRGGLGLGACMLLVAAALSAGCLFGSESAQEEELARNRELWASQQILSYDVEYHSGCFCPPPRQMRLQVRDRVLVSVVSLDGQPVGPLPFVHTVDQAFDAIADAMAEGADRVTVSYHPTLGHPVSVFIDHSFQAADEETVFDLRELVPLR